jgi:ubiquinone biosynthesis protein Coq4
MKLKNPNIHSPLSKEIWKGGEFGKKLHKAVIKLRSKMLVYLTHKMALPILKIIRKPILFPLSLEALCNLPKNTLGNDLYLFLQEKKLTLLPYYAKHDLKHILLQYDTTDEGEVCLQCFMLGNKHFSFPVVATVLYGFFTMPEHWKKFIQANRRGAASPSLQHWDWFALLPLNTFLLQQKINTNDNIA